MGAKFNKTFQEWLTLKNIKFIIPLSTTIKLEHFYLIIFIFLSQLLKRINTQGYIMIHGQLEGIWQVLLNSLS